MAAVHGVRSMTDLNRRELPVVVGVWLCDEF